MKKGNVNKWDLPGWKFEPAYSSRTLVGDWFEERNMFLEGNMSCITSNMAEYKVCNSDYKSRDWPSMWNNRIVQQSGFGIKYLLDYHSNDYVIRRLSTYNLEYSSPFRIETTKYQPRRWDRNTLRWEPEKMDLPISKNKTLYETIQKMKFPVTLGRPSKESIDALRLSIWEMGKSAQPHLQVEIELLLKTNLRDITMKEKSKQEKAFVFSTPQDSSSKAPKFFYRHLDKEQKRDINIDK